MKLITANKLNRFWVNGILPELKKKIEGIRVLKTTEEVEANTNAENIVSANVIGELISKSGGCSLEQKGNDFYIVGADSVRKKLGSGNFQITINMQVGYAKGDAAESAYNYTNITLVITCKDGKVSYNDPNKTWSFTYNGTLSYVRFKLLSVTYKEL